MTIQNLLQAAICGAALALANSAHAAEWPATLAELPEAQMLQVAGEVPNHIAFEKYKLIHFKPTVGEHGIALYEAQVVLDYCDDGTRGWRYHYIDLYVEGSRIKFATNWSRSECFAD